jgi:hypothetical protein
LSSFTKDPEPPRPFDAEESKRAAQNEFKELWKDSLLSQTVGRHSALVLAKGLTDKPVTSPLLIPIKFQPKHTDSPPPNSKLLQYGKLKRYDLEAI